MKRSGRFYRRNEAEVMEALGLQPTPGSGCGWVVKEDGQSDDVICQLKSTDATSIKVAKFDFDKLQYNAAVAKKLPVFAIQFLQSNELYLVVRPEDIQDLTKYLDTGEKPDLPDPVVGIDLGEEPSVQYSMSVVRSSSSARERFVKEIEKKYIKGRKSAL